MSRAFTLTVSFLFACIVVLLLTWLPFSWLGWQMEYCGLHNCYCEPFRDTYFVRQPLTAASNLGFILAGLVILTHRLSASAVISPSFRGKTFKNWYGTALLVAGFCSFISHASLTRAGEWLDLMGVYTILGFLMLVQLSRVKKVTFPFLVWLYAFFLFCTGLQMVFATQFQQFVIVLLVAGTIMLEIILRKRSTTPGSYRRLALALFLLAVAGFLWTLNGFSQLCDPQTGLPWHIGWHVFSAAGLATYYFYLSDQAVEIQK